VLAHPASGLSLLLTLSKHLLFPSAGGVASSQQERPAQGSAVSSTPRPLQAQLPVDSAAEMALDGQPTQPTYRK
jgi:hypothetical protein